MGGALTGLAAAAFSSSAVAVPPIEIVAPNEWQLPYFNTPTNIIMQTGIYQTNNRAYNSNGDNVKGPGGTTVEGITRFAHAWSTDNNNVGMFWEALVPEVWQSMPNGNDVSGMGDPIFDYTIYKKPTKDSLIGFQNLVSIPVGSSEVSNHAWIEMPAVIANYGIGKWDFNGTFGAGIFSSATSPGCGLDNCGLSLGNIYYADVSAGYQITPVVEVALMDTWQITEPGHVRATHSYLQGNFVNDIAPVVRINFRPTTWLSLWYYNSTNGRNSTKTNALMFRFVDIL
ncbi:MAG TPA: transporter [Rhodanobacteraceae bacterium]